MYIDSFLNNDINCVAGSVTRTDRYKYEFTKKFVKKHEYTIYEKMINLCDLMCKYNVMTLEKRIIEIMLRRGCHENTLYYIAEAQKLKQYFDNMLGFNIYKLLPDILFN